MPKLIVAFCTYNRASRLPELINALRQQTCPVPFEILAVNNNSKDNTLAVLEQLAHEPGVTLRFVTESQPGIVPARNRATEECLAADYMLFLDDDELPRPGWLAAAHTALTQDDAACVGGRV
ncbi:MAG: glycosyltransferase, partial [bacterium]|nr:glycosyltransferase [bacterium]